MRDLELFRLALEDGRQLAAAALGELRTRAARTRTGPPTPARHAPWHPAPLPDPPAPGSAGWFPQRPRGPDTGSVLTGPDGAVLLADPAKADAAAQRPAAGPKAKSGGAASARPQAGASRHLAKYVAATLEPGAVTRVQRRHTRFAQREILWRESGLKRVRGCGRWPVVKGDRIAVKVREDVAHYAGAQTCGSVHACPVCQAKILDARAVQISAAAAGWMAGGNTVLMVGFTMPHDAADRLAETIDVIANGFRYVGRHRAWKRARKAAQVAGTIRSLEETHWLNGWHPHLHVLYFICGSADATQLARLGVTLRQLWGDYITSRGYRRPDVLHGVDIQVCRSGVDAGLYVAKTDDGKSVGNEMARGDLKQGRRGHRTRAQILEDFRQTADLEDLALIHEHERATKGRQRITWSPGLRKLLLAEGIDLAPERTDEEIAAAEVGGRVVLLVEPDSWRKITRTPGLVGQLLDVTERRGVPGAIALLRDHDCQWSLPPDEAKPP